MTSIFQSLFRGYSPWEVALEIAVIWAFVWTIVRFLRNTRGAGAIKGFALVVGSVALAVRILGQVGGTDTLGRLRFLADQVLVLLVISLVVVFQPEIRQAMSRLGQTRLFGRNRLQAGTLAGEVAEAVDFLSRSRFGALIVIERSVPLGSLTDGGTELDAKVTSSLLQSIFWPNNPLHDLATVIRGGRVWCAGMQLPLAEEGSVPSHLGARHRAGLGVTVDTDCVVVIVSEETGSIRIAQHGQLSGPIARDAVEEKLLAYLESDTSDPTSLSDSKSASESAA
ncbi:MAG: DNA integrity scanning protein DisA nucleotide-binding domain protein [Phycisphaerae bacterium]|jgi:diadenylate cyclase|nr:DNA integrity scanning protein DisA nucleotide-binding domain protein [Phycisphaerae bacterium]